MNRLISVGLDLLWMPRHWTSAQSGHCSSMCWMWGPFGAMIRTPSTLSSTKSFELSAIVMAVLCVTM
jgi:hypothetical protein